MFGIGTVELIAAFIPMLIMLGVGVFVITLLYRLVRAVEKIADKIELK